jgi:hypothetical protein
MKGCDFDFLGMGLRGISGCGRPVSPRPCARLSGKRKIQPDRGTEDFGREPLAGVAGTRELSHPPISCARPNAWFCRKLGGSDTVEFFFSELRDWAAAKRFLTRALDRHGRPERIVIDGSQTNREAILSCDTTDRLRDRSRRRLKPIRIRKSQYLNNKIEQDHRAIKRRVRPMLGFKAMHSARSILGGIEMVHMMRKRQAQFAFNPRPSLAEQFDIIAA